MSRAVFALFALLHLAPAVKADPVPPAAEVRSTYTSGEKVCGKLSLAALTGKSPWLVMGVGGAVDYFNTPDERKDQLGLFATPWVWGTMLVLVLLVGFKDTILSVFSQLKMPLNALAEAFHAGGGVFGVVYLGYAAFGGEPAADTQMQGLTDTSAAPTLFDHAGRLLLWLLMAAVHVAVWIVFNTVEVVILINPVPFIDTALKTVRTLLIGLISGAAALHPLFGFVLALPVILLSVWLLPFAVRFAVAGWVFTVDVFKRLFGVKPQPGAAVRAFAGLGFRGVPVGVYGTVDRGPAGPEFVYRRWFVFPRRVPIPWERVAICTGMVPRLIDTSDRGGTWLRFPPRYRRMEQDLALALGLGEVVHRSLGDSLGQQWKRLREWVNGKRGATA